MNWNSNQDENDLAINIQIYFELLEEKLEYPHVKLTKENIESIITILEDKRRDTLKLLHKDYREAISLLVGLSSNAYKYFHNSPQSQMYKEEEVKLDITKDDFSESYEKLLDEEKLIVDQAHVIYQEIILK